MNRPNLNPRLEQLHTPLGTGQEQHGPLRDDMDRIERDSLQKVQNSMLWNHILSYMSSRAFCNLCVLHISLEAHQRRSVPTHQRELSSLADVTHPASVIERDANPAPLQSQRGGTGRDTERDMRKEVGYGRQGDTCRLQASWGTQHRPGLERQVLS